MWRKARSAVLLPAFILVLEEATRYHILLPNEPESCYASVLHRDAIAISWPHISRRTNRKEYNGTVLHNMCVKIAALRDCRSCQKAFGSRNCIGP
jgi:hypothetical protein